MLADTGFYTFVTAFSKDICHLLDYRHTLLDKPMPDLVLTRLKHTCRPTISALKLVSTPYKVLIAGLALVFKSEQFSRDVAYALLRFLFLIMHLLDALHQACKAAKQAYLHQMRQNQTHQTASSTAQAQGSTGSSSSNSSNSSSLASLKALQLERSRLKANLGNSLPLLWATSVADQPCCWGGGCMQELRLQAWHGPSRSILAMLCQSVCGCMFTYVMRNVSVMLHACHTSINPYLLR